MARSQRGRGGARGIPLRKRLGQHHLVSGELCQPIVDFLVPAGQLVWEIGPGGGVLTRRLVDAGARVVAVEIDLAWGLGLAGSVDRERVCLVIGDALDLPWRRLPPGSLVAGNLPFNVGTAIIERLLRQSQNVSRAAFLVQREVAERLLAASGEEAYGALSVLVAARCRATYLGPVRSGSFRPAPRVEAAFVGLEPTPPPLGEEEMVSLEATVRSAFAQRRKQLSNALGARWGRRESRLALAAAGIDPRRRAETLSLDDFLRLHRAHRLSLRSSGD